MKKEVYKTNRDGLVEVIEKLPKQFVKVRFISTGAEKVVSLHNLKKGKAADPTITNRKEPPQQIDEIFTSNNSGDFRAVLKYGNKYLIQFLDTGYSCEVFIENAKKGKVRDPYKPSVYSRGYEGVFDKKKHPYWKQAKQLWCNMMKRCYSEKDPKGYFHKGVTVDDRWLCFANFLEDLPKLKNFSLWVNNGTTKYNLDKDLIVRGNKVYSKELCQFITEFENKSEGSKSKNGM